MTLIAPTVIVVLKAPAITSTQLKVLAITSSSGGENEDGFGRRNRIPANGDVGTGVPLVRVLELRDVICLRCISIVTCTCHPSCSKTRIKSIDIEAWTIIILRKVAPWNILNK